MKASPAPEKCQTGGRYCPEGTGTQDGFACADGTWSNDRDPSGDDVNSNCFACSSGIMIMLKYLSIINDYRNSHGNKILNIRRD